MASPLARGWVSHLIELLKGLGAALNQRRVQTLLRVKKQNNNDTNDQQFVNFVDDVDGQDTGSASIHSVRSDARRLFSGRLLGSAVRRVRRRVHSSRD